MNSRPTASSGKKSSSIEGYLKTSTSKMTIQGTYETKVLTDGTTTCVFYCKREVTEMFAKVTITYTKSNKVSSILNKLPILFRWRSEAC